MGCKKGVSTTNRDLSTRPNESSDLFLFHPQVVKIRPTLYFRSSCSDQNLGKNHKVYFTLKLAFKKKKKKKITMKRIVALLLKHRTSAPLSSRVFLPGACHIFLSKIILLDRGVGVCWSAHLIILFGLQKWCTRMKMNFPKGHLRSTKLSPLNFSGVCKFFSREHYLVAEHMTRQNLVEVEEKKKKKGPSVRRSAEDERLSVVRVAVGSAAGILASNEAGYKVDGCNGAGKVEHPLAARTHHRTRFSPVTFHPASQIPPRPSPRSFFYRRFVSTHPPYFNRNNFFFTHFYFNF